MDRLAIAKHGAPLATVDPRGTSSNAHYVIQSLMRTDVED